MDHKKLILVAATALMALPVDARTPKAETFADLKNMIIDDKYISTGVLPKNVTREQREAIELVRKGNNRAIVDVFTHSLPAAKKRKRAEMIFNSELLEDANFFSSKKENTVFKHIDRTMTHVGQVVLAATLAEGTTDLDVLKQRSSMIREIIAHEDLRDNLFNIMAEFEKNETDLLTRWSSSDAEALNKKVAEASAKLGFIDKALKATGNGALRVVQYGVPSILLAGLAANIKLTSSGGSKPGLVLNGIVGAISALIASKHIYDSMDRKLNKSIDEDSLIKKTVAGFNALVQTVNKIEGELLEHAKQESLPASLAVITELKERIVELNNKLNELTAKGALQEAAVTIDNNIDRISTMLSFIGEVDAYLSMARHYLDLADKRGSGDERMVVDFCTFNTTSATPYIRAEGYWNAILEPTVAKTSSIELGGATKSRNAIVTGPNAGGKSVALRGLINQLILAHSYQMAWARKFETTPFKLVIGQLNNVDDLSAGDSRLMAEVKAMRSIIQRAKKLDGAKGEFAFVVTDELFTGTEVKEAIDISLEMGQEFADLTNVMYILATHYKELTTLEQITGGVFKNYRVEAYITKGDTGVNEVTYPFKLFPGVGQLNVALDIMLLQMKNREMENDSFYARLLALQARNQAKAKASGLAE